jgi:hypothetical protein
MLTVILAVAFVVTKRRLSDAEVEVERVRAATAAASAAAAETAFDDTAETAGGVGTKSGGDTAEAASIGSELSSEWEQAVPPMDS